MACGDPHLQNFSTCSKWQQTYSICCQVPTHQRMPQAYFPYYNNAIQTHFPCKSLSYPHHALPESTTNPFFFHEKQTPQLPPPHLTVILTTMHMELVSQVGFWRYHNFLWVRKNPLRVAFGTQNSHF